MRDLVAALIALFLLFVAASLATTLHVWRQRRWRAHEAERRLGRTIVAEIPVGDELRLFSEDETRFYYGDESVDKDRVCGVRLMLDGAPIAAVGSRAVVDSQRDTQRVEAGEDLAREGWNVAIETATGAVLVRCGALREGISQDLARRVFDAVKDSLHHSVSGT